MQKVIHICDKCKVEKVYNKFSDSEFRQVKFLISKKGTTYIQGNGYLDNVATMTEVFLCSDCQSKLGIKQEEEEPKFYKTPDLRDKIYELFETIVSDLGYKKGE
jgi:hypothetical protein